MLVLAAALLLDGFETTGALPKVSSMAAEQQVQKARLAVVGDVHGLWVRTANKDADEAALGCLNPNTVIFLGDFGEEDVELVQEVGALKKPSFASQDVPLWSLRKNQARELDNA
eukprot:scaffold11334_cov17-Tisochrysis_lutea.AAC.2